MTDVATLAPDLSKERLRVWLRLLKVTRGIEAELRDRLRREFDTTLPRFDVMAALARAEDGMRMSELSGALRVSNGNITGIVERLVADGLVQRSPIKGDRRAMCVSLTADGSRRFEDMAAAHELWVDEMLGSVGPEGLSALRGPLDRVAERLDRRT